MTGFIIHVGPHKTGTTYIQETLAALREPLRECKILVPAIWNAAPGIPSHMKLAWAIRSHDLTEVRDQVREILAQRPRYVVISCEALSKFDQEQIVQLRQVLGPAPAQIVYYVRRWPERLPSLWQETVKFGHTTTFPEFLAEQLTSLDGSALQGTAMQDTAMIDRFAAVFGATQIKVVSYSHLTDLKLDIAEHFLTTFLGLSDIELPDVGRPNQALSILDTELIRVLNVIHARHGGVQSPALREWLLPRKDVLVPNALLDAMRNSSGVIRLDEAAPLLVGATNDLLSRYAPSIIPPRHAGGLHEPRVIDVPYVRQDYLLEPWVPKVLRDINDIYRRTL